MPAPEAETRRQIRLTVAVLAAAFVAVVVYAWFALAGAELSANGYIALVLGVVITIAVGVGLMALVFWSHRRGYDDRAGGGDGN